MSMPVGREGDDETGLMRRIAQGDGDALAALVAIYEQRVRRLAFRLMGWNGDVDDVVQEVFLAVLEKAGGFRGDASAWTWITAITLNRCRTYRRRRAVRERIASVLRFGPPSHGQRAGQRMFDDETAAQVREAVARLPGRDREVVVLHYLEHKPPAQIAALLGVSQNAVEVRLHRARARLKSRLANLMEGVKS